MNCKIATGLRDPQARRFVFAGAVRWLAKLTRKIYLVALSRDIVKYAQLILECFHITASLDWEYDKHISDLWLHDRSLPVRDNLQETSQGTDKCYDSTSRPNKRLRKRGV